MRGASRIDGHLVRHHADVRMGGAAAEFALSIAGGLRDPESPGALRLHDDGLHQVAASSDEFDATDAPLLSGLLRYIHREVHPDQYEPAPPE